MENKAHNNENINLLWMYIIMILHITYTKFQITLNFLAKL
jgi:hypothetical protein